MALRLGLIGLVLALAATVFSGLPASAGPPPIRPTTPPTIPTFKPGWPPTGPTLPPTNGPTVPSTPVPLIWAGFGDSYTVGEGASRNHVYKAKPGGEEDYRHQSGLAPFLLAFDYLEVNRYQLGEYTAFPTEIPSTWGADRMIFNASSGAETKHLTKAQTECKKCTEIRNPPQLQGVPSDTNLVYFGLGGNDAGFGSLMSTAFDVYFWRWTRANWVSRQIRAVQMEVQRLFKRMPQVSANVEQGLVDVNTAANQAEIIVALYPLAIKPSGNSDTTQISGAALDMMYPFAVAVNQAIKDAVDRFRARFPNVKVHVFDPNTAGPNGTSVVAGHELGQPDSYFNGVVYRGRVFGQFKFFKAYQESFHPNEPGAVVLGQALANWMTVVFPAWFPKGPDFNRVHVDAQVSAGGPDTDDEFEEWARNNPEEVCEEADIDSICHFINTDGEITIPIEVVNNPVPLPPIFGAPTVGGPGGGSPGGGPAPSTWIPATYSSAPTGVPAEGMPTNGSTGDPCDLVAVNPGYQVNVTVSTSTLSGGGLSAPMDLTWVQFSRTVKSDPCEKKEKVDPTEIQQMIDDWLGTGDGG
ncbi:SGNH/GDSL hydrolase family protein [Sphaerisporangium corydalis]|uniref:SGNH hydrolase-type esterase domain-containing protein n=1 Tax=Sphaerisporangium corydalis TaxID=1441875 RepID=A0ABV9ENN8_9ACTN|nr:hypothetical protein [Sphaerisporangium corydalis]